MIHQVMTVTVFGYLTLISRDFYDFISLLSFGLDWAVYQTLKTVSDHISKHLEVRQKYFAAHRTFNTDFRIRYIREFKKLLRRRQGQRRLKSEFIFYLRISRYS